MISVPAWVLITMTSGLLTIGIAVGSIGAKFVTRKEYALELKAIRKRISKIFDMFDNFKTDILKSDFLKK